MFTSGDFGLVMGKEEASGKYGKEEAKQRFEAALRGSLKVGPKPMKKMKPKRGKLGARRKHEAD